jgi:hypothetical protein
VTRRYSPDPDALAAALAARVDRLEHDTGQAATDLASLGRGVAQLTAQIRLHQHELRHPERHSARRPDSGSPTGHPSRLSRSSTALLADRRRGDIRCARPGAVVGVSLELR